MPLVIRALDRRDRRRITADVAGPAALLIAKLHKVADRIGQAGRSNDKDAHDVYRLLRGIDTGALAAGVTRLLAHPLSAPVTREGVSHLERNFGAPMSSGCRMIVRAVGGDLLADAETIAASCAALVVDLLGAVRR